ncbi:MAG: hsp70 family protein [Parachlamydia sp.]|jgi:hypothetical protein|nr:hsp70 family protein [Parachlamydia sp.]
MRYLIGIDLGTTNSAIAYKDTAKRHGAADLFMVPQFTAPGKVDSLSTLPSFCYLLEEHEWPQGTFSLPWKKEEGNLVGQFAKLQGARVPSRMIQSAKSWLCNVASNRHDKILPMGADASRRMSPVDASARYLAHIKEVWNYSIAKNNPDLVFEEQDIILTVPASFDETARALTVEAAKKAGLQHVTLLEEPQAAFYSWIAQHEHDWKKIFQPDDRVLVCDVGGGTTDFSLIEVHEKNGELVFQRMAVGDHLLLGGDNMDLAIAHYLENRLNEQGKGPLEGVQWLQLLAESRRAKEQVFALESKTEEFISVVLQGTGSSVVKGSLTVAFSSGELRDFLFQGFFSPCVFAEALQLKKSRGMRTVGLPYEDDPSIIKHLASFLNQADAGLGKRGPTHVLFNGGAMKPALFQGAIIDALKQWFHEPVPQVLQSPNLDLAVAKGAAYYAGVRKGHGQSIGGGLPRSYYLQYEAKDPAGQLVKKMLTVLPRGSEEGKEFHPAPVFTLRANVPVSFHLFTSHVRLNDKEGDAIQADKQEVQRLPPIQTLLRFGKSQAGLEEKLIPVRLGIRLNPIGTLDLWLDSQESDHRWNLEFQIRSSSGQDHDLALDAKGRQDVTYSEEAIEPAKEILIEAFRTGIIKPSQMMDKLEEAVQMNRKEWPVSVLRSLFDTLLKMSAGRGQSAEHEARWWNLAGYLLRPGHGYPLDDFRMKELWKIILNDLKTAKNLESQIQRLICYRRIAGGLSKGQQMQLAGELLSTLFDKKTGKLALVRKGDKYFFSEKIRALAALERLEIPQKVKLGQALMEKITKQEGDEHDFWALGRVAARHLVYGSAGQVIPKETCAKWVSDLLHVKQEEKPYAAFAFKQMAKKTPHRELNMDDELIKKIYAACPSLKENERVEEAPLSRIEQEQLFGENLPPGLLLEEF